MSRIIGQSSRDVVAFRVRRPSAAGRGKIEAKSKRKLARWRESAYKRHRGNIPSCEHWLARRGTYAQGHGGMEKSLMPARRRKSAYEAAHEQLHQATIFVCPAPS